MSPPCEKTVARGQAAPLPAWVVVSDVLARAQHHSVRTKRHFNSRQRCHPGGVLRSLTKNNPTHWLPTCRSNHQFESLTLSSHWLRYSDAEVAQLGSWMAAKWLQNGRWISAICLLQRSTFLSSIHDHYSAHMFLFPSKKILFLDLQLPLAATTPTNTQDAPKWPKTLPSSPKFTTSTRTKFKTTLYLNLFCQGPPLCSRIKRSALGESRKRPRTLIFFFFFFFLLGSHRCTKSVVPKNRGL